MKSFYLFFTSAMLPYPNIHAATPAFKTKAQCETRYSDLKDQCQDMKRALDTANKRIESLLKAKTLREPTWAELSALIKNDDGDTKSYKRDRYNCEDFALALRDVARDAGFEAAYVSLNYENSNAGHAVVAFLTLDHGLIYVEPQHDQIGFVEIGKPFGTIPMEAVKPKYLACPKETIRLLEPLTTETYKGRIFDFGYYENYQERFACYEKSLDAYNSAVREFNLGKRTLTKQKMETWSKNLELLQLDLGNKRIEQDNLVVSNIKRHW